MNARATIPLLPLAMTLGVGCASPGPLPKWPTSSPAELCGKSPEDTKFCMPAAELEGWMKRQEFTITHAAVSDSGTTNPYKLRLQLADGRSFSAKFKPAPEEFDAFNNSPRRELAAYEIQKLFLDEADFVVPPTVLTCIPVERYKSLMPDLDAHDDVDCSIGILSYWIEGLTSDGILDDARWENDPRYLESLGHLSVLTVLIGHQDDIGDNFYRLKDETAPAHLFAIDNGLAFSAMGANPIQLFSSSWSTLKVDALPKKTVDKLRGLEPKALEKLAVVAQFRLDDENDKFVPLGHTKPFDPTDGVREDGDVMQLGLTSDEITDVNIRLVELLAKVREGEVKQTTNAAMR